MSAATLTGFFTGLSLILAIGAQNAFVLRQGLLQSHVFPLALFCAASDALLIAAGVAGFGALTAALPALPVVMSLAGAGFLIVYGITRLRAAWIGGHRLAPEGEAHSLGRTLLLAAAFTWANPHVYLDTLGLIGAVSTSFAAGMERLAFGIGAVFASFVFFFSLGYGARLLAPLMRSATAWRVLDGLIGVTMLAIAAKLLLGLV
ncbi:LysE/ArgO family amino acid transporter [Sinisalibacter aestuarii]|uniref:Amino acid transporter n=1 Tax=Sinisalibacter aestuarii TaxID=2949426 RepID=A0ABQ5LSF6_9RHOB|nr:LysE family transporter [Sinisalibacter aestuarii]GKY87673.1 amino acid transporter [Sinisalibacter aestuarii]